MSQADEEIQWLNNQVAQLSGENTHLMQIMENMIEGEPEEDPEELEIVPIDKLDRFVILVLF